MTLRSRGVLAAYLQLFTCEFQYRLEHLVPLETNVRVNVRLDGSIDQMVAYQRVETIK